MLPFLKYMIWQGEYKIICKYQGIIEVTYLPVTHLSKCCSQEYENVGGVGKDDSTPVADENNKNGGGDEATQDHDHDANDEEKENSHKRASTGRNESVEKGGKRKESSSPGRVVKEVDGAGGNEASEGITERRKSRGASPTQGNKHFLIVIISFLFSCQV